MNPLLSLRAQGQSVWLDFLSRRYVADGSLARLVAQDGIGGVTSNPAIFEKAIAGSDDYDPALAAALKDGAPDVSALYESLAFDDIRAAADALRPVHEASGGRDGFVSLEVSPYLAEDCAGTIAEAKRFWAAVARPNLMIKVPATEACIPAIEALIAEGIAVNVTLLFAQDVYERVALAFIAGLEKRHAAGLPVAGIGSVASFFISRIDTAVDAELDRKIANGANKAAREALKGRIAIANAKLAYARYQQLFGDARWKALEKAGAQPQRLLWASTGTKNKAYPDTLYVDELIGPDTVNTMPPATLDAFRDHGRVATTITAGVAEARAALEALAHAGVSLSAITESLVAQGVALFCDAADTLLGALAEKRARLLGDRLDAQHLALPAALQAVFGETQDAWRKAGTVRRLWQRDASIWTGRDEARWLDWLTIAARESAAIGALEQFAQEVKARGYRDVLLIGMGGSSLGPEVLGTVFGAQAGWPRLHVLDSTDPAQIRATAAALDPAHTLVIASSKSGTTLEPNILLEYFLAEALSRDASAAQHFVAVTDPGSALERRAREVGFWKVFHGVPEIGGRFSVLSRFGLVPAAACGLPVRALLAEAQAMAQACGADVPPSANPGVALGLVLGLAAKAGRDKLMLVASPELASFGAWVEQLVAESTGKDGVSIIPIDGEALRAPGSYGPDRVFVFLSGAGETPSAAAALAAAGHPVVRITVPRPAAVAQEFFRLEIATAVAGAVLGVNPFDQPDVEANKLKTRALTETWEKDGPPAEAAPLVRAGALALYADEARAAALRAQGAATPLSSWLKAHWATSQPGDFLAVLAFLPRDAETTKALEAMRSALATKTGHAVALGFGPRFLHSTGQAYKGGRNNGVFLQITATPAQDVPVPESRLTFGMVEAAQAEGDRAVLIERGRRVLRVHLTGDLSAALSALGEAIAASLA